MYQLPQWPRLPGVGVSIPYPPSYTLLLGYTLPPERTWYQRYPTHWKGPGTKDILPSCEQKTPVKTLPSSNSLAVGNNYKFPKLYPDSKIFISQYYAALVVCKLYFICKIQIAQNSHWPLKLCSIDLYCDVFFRFIITELYFVLWTKRW